MTAPTTGQKNLFIGNAHLARQMLQCYNAATNTMVPWTGPATVSLCTMTTDPTTGEVVYTPVVGPFNMVSVVAGVVYYIFPAGAIAALNMPPYLNATIYQVVIGGDDSELQDVQPFVVCPSRYPL